MSLIPVNPADEIPSASSQAYRVSAPLAPQPLGSSWRFRRLVIGGRVLLDPVALAQPAMTGREVACLKDVLKSVRRAVEFGAGGSTAVMVGAGLERIVSIESDIAWVSRLGRDEKLAQAVASERLTLLHVDIGPTGFMGGPKSRLVQEAWAAYSLAPWGHVAEGEPDFALVDGRFRVACIMESVLRLRPGALILVHDFWNRPAYHGVLPFVETLRKVDSLAVFRVRPDIDRAAAIALLEGARYTPL